MKRKLVALSLVVAGTALAATLAFSISSAFIPGPDGVPTNVVMVNAQPEPLTYATRYPVAGTQATMRFNNGWTQIWTIAIPRSSAPWYPIVGTEVNVNQACRSLPDYLQNWCRNQTGMNSPIVVDLGKDGIKLGERGVTVAFDIDADGTPERIQWVRVDGDEAFLALDRNDNGVIDNGAELFGNHMPLANGQPALDGYDALAQYDSDGNGKLTAHDDAWQRLLLWHDVNADGISTPDEITTLEANGITMLSVRPSVSSGTFDAAGNWLPLWGWAMTRDKPHWMATADVWFFSNQEN